MNQLTLDIDRDNIITGQRCLPLIDSISISRMVMRGTIVRGQAFYCLKNGSHKPVLWGGKGQKPRWVDDWLEMGGSIDDLKARI